jgi:hypothetical protein
LNVIGLAVVGELIQNPRNDEPCDDIQPLNVADAACGSINRYANKG